MDANKTEVLTELAEAMNEELVAHSATFVAQTTTPTSITAYPRMWWWESFEGDEWEQLDLSGTAFFVRYRLDGIVALAGIGDEAGIDAMETEARKWEDRVFAAVQAHYQLDGRVRRVKVFSAKPYTPQLEDGFHIGIRLPFEIECYVSVNRSP